MELMENTLLWGSDIDQEKADIFTVNDVLKVMGADLVGVLDQKTGKVFVSPKESNQVKKILMVTDEFKHMWTTPTLGKMEVHELEDYNFSTQLNPNITMVAQNYQCQRYLKNVCINFHYHSGEFAFSWKPTEELHLCKKKRGDYCAFTAKRVQLQAHRQKDCTGPVEQVSTTWKFCSPV